MRLQEVLNKKMDKNFYISNEKNPNRWWFNYTFSYRCFGVHEYIYDFWLWLFNLIVLSITSPCIQFHLIIIFFTLSLNLMLAQDSFHCTLAQERNVLFFYLSNPGRPVLYNKWALPRECRRAPRLSPLHRMVLNIQIATAAPAKPSNFC